jgi:hypothetical protein
MHSGNMNHSRSHSHVPSGLTLNHFSMYRYAMLTGYGRVALECQALKALHVLTCFADGSLVSQNESIHFFLVRQ